MVDQPDSGYVALVAFEQQVVFIDPVGNLNVPVCEGGNHLIIFEKLKSVKAMKLEQLFSRNP